MSAWASSLADRVFKREKCEKLIKYQDRSFEFKGVGIEIPGFKLSFEGFSTEPKVLQEATEAAKALDDLQYQLCQNLSKKSITDLLDREVLTRYAKARMSSLFLFSSFRLALEAFKNDQERQRENLEKSIEDIQKFTSSLTIEDLVAPEGLSPRGLDAISSALSSAQVDEQELDKVLLDKFAEFEKTQREILERLKQVQEYFETQVTELRLSGASVELVTAQTRFAKGETDRWIKGYFRDADIKSSYDARRPITDKIIRSIENNVGTIIYGRPHYGKTMLLKRVMFEQIEKGEEYAAIYCREIGANPNHLIRLLQRVSALFSKILVIVDDTHRKGSEEMFVAFNNLPSNEDEENNHYSSHHIRFLFAAAEAELKTMIENLTSRDKANEVKDALRKLEKNKITLDFDINDAIIFVEKALAVTKPMQVNEKSKGEVKDVAQHLFEEVSKGDPFTFVCSLIHYLTKNELASKDFIESEMNEKLNQLIEHDDKKHALVCACIGAFGFLIYPWMVEYCGVREDRLLSLVGKSILFKNKENYQTRNEVWALEFLLYVFSKRCNGSYLTFENTYGVGGIIQCIVNTTAMYSIDLLLAILNRTTLLYNNQRYQPIAKAFLDNFLTQLPEPITVPDIKADFYCFGLGNFYSSLHDHHNDAIKYYDKAIGIQPFHVTAWYNKGVALYDSGSSQEAIKCFDRVIELDLNHAPAWNIRGVAHGKLGKHEEAIACYDKALTIDSYLDYVWSNKGYELLILGRFEEAIKCYNRALEINPNNAFVWYNRVCARIKKGDIENGLEDLKKAIELDKKYIESAKQDKDFESIRNDERFKALVIK